MGPAQLSGSNWLAFRWDMPPFHHSPRHSISDSNTVIVCQLPFGIMLFSFAQLRSPYWHLLSPPGYCTCGFLLTLTPYCIYYCSHFKDKRTEAEPKEKFGQIHIEDKWQSWERIRASHLTSIALPGVTEQPLAVSLHPGMLQLDLLQLRVSSENQIAVFLLLTRKPTCHQDGKSVLWV